MKYRRNNIALGPKALWFSQPRATPWGTGSLAIFLPAQRANSSLRRTVGPLGRYNSLVLSHPQGVALGWENGRPFGAANR